MRRRYFPEQEVNDLNRMVEDELSAMEQIARLAIFHQHQQFQLAVREHQRLAWDAVSQAQAQLNNPSVMQRDLSLRLGTKLKILLCSREPTRCTSNINSLKKEKLK